jgi:hypothetical protein
MTTAVDSNLIDIALRQSAAQLNANLEGVDDELAARPAAPGANSALWLYGHITYWRSMMAGIAGASPVWGDDEASEFRGIMLGPPPNIDGWSFDRLRPVFDEATARLRAAVADGLAPDVLEKLTRLSIHESYHVGQVGLWRRTQGLPGVIGKRS